MLIGNSWMKVRRGGGYWMDAAVVREVYEACDTAGR